MHNITLLKVHSLTSILYYNFSHFFFIFQGTQVWLGLNQNWQRKDITFYGILKFED